MSYSSTRLTDGFGFVARTVHDCQRELDGWMIGQRSRMNIVRETGDFNEALAFLSHLTFPATRHVMVPFGSSALFINNKRDGSDFADYATQVSRKLHARTARVVDEPARSSGTGAQREILSYEARILEIYEDGELTRSVTCKDDGGRWVFETSGDELPVEKTFDYQARRKRDRFTSANLKDLLSAFGFPCPDMEAVAGVGHYVLVHEQLLHPPSAQRVEDAARTLAQRDDPAFGYYQRGLGWVPFMQTHAESVIADFERAVRLNPAYLPLVEQHLERARKVTRNRS